MTTPQDPQHDRPQQPPQGPAYGYPPQQPGYGYPNPNQQPQQGAPVWGHPAGFTPNVQPPKKKTGRNLGIGCLGAFVLTMVIVVIATVASSGGSDSEPATVAAPTHSSAPAAPHHAKAKATHKAKLKPKVVLTESGNGIKSTKSFEVTGDWDLSYTYNCASFGYSGNFIVQQDLTPLVNELGAKGSDVTHQHDADGNPISLEVNSECSWTLKVTQL